MNVAPATVCPGGESQATAFTVESLPGGGAGGARETFRNPIARGADPCLVYHRGYYYWCASDKERAVVIHRSTTLTERGRKVIVWRAPLAGPHRAQLWAPELHWLDGRWYIYVAASDGDNATHRMIVLESVGDDPAGQFHFKAELYTGDHLSTGQLNRWAIDGTVLERGGRRYFLWSGWADERDEQWLYIAEMANPWTIASNRVRICANDDHPWERVDETPESRGLNEGPQVLARNGRVFVIYSASASWLPTYKLGLLELIAQGDPMNPGAWSKRAEPVFASNAATWGVGHCGFTQSPDGSEDWLVYHAKVNRRPNWDRVIHAQRFGWGADGTPVFGDPVAAGTPLDRPSLHAGTASSAVALGRAALAALIGMEPMVKGVHVSEVPVRPSPEPEAPTRTAAVGQP